MHKAHADVDSLKYALPLNLGARVQTRTHSHRHTPHSQKSSEGYRRPRKREGEKKKVAFIVFRPFISSRLGEGEYRGWQAVCVCVKVPFALEDPPISKYSEHAGIPWNAIPK